MIAVLLLFAIVLLIRNYVKHNKKMKSQKAVDSLSRAESSSIHEVIEESADNVSKAIRRVGKVYKMTITGLCQQEQSKLKKAKLNVAKLEMEIEDLQNDIFYFIKELDDSYLGASKFYIDSIGALQDIAQSSSLINKVSLKHVINQHKKLKKRESGELMQIMEKMSVLLDEVSRIFEERVFDELVPEVIEGKKNLLEEVEMAIQKQVERTREKDAVSPKNTTLFFIILIETKDLIQACLRVLDLYYEKRDRS